MARVPFLRSGIATAGVLGVFILGGAGLLVLIILAIVLSASGMGSGSGSSSVTCTPGDGGSSSVEIPEEYQDSVEGAAAESGFSVELIGSQIYHESSWDPEASSGLADGIAQFTPDTWAEYGNGGDVNDPEAAIAAQGRYMADMREQFEEHADDEEHLTELALAAYNAGPGMPEQFDYDLGQVDQQLGSEHDYVNQTLPYVENIMAASDGNYASDCSHGGDVPEGDIVEASMHLAWDDKVELEHSTADDHGRDDSKEEYVEVAEGIGDPTHAYFTDCGVFVASVMISSGVDPDYVPRSTSAQLAYLENNDDYEFFTPTSEGDLEPGDILIIEGPNIGHTYIYTGERHSADDGRAQGASLYTRPPSGHDIWLSDSNGTYQVARYQGDNA